MGFIPIIHGVKKEPIGITEAMVKCPACEVDVYADIMVISEYYHFWFIPIFPTGKEINIICQKCGLKRYELPFNAKTLSQYDELKNRFKHPWHTYVVMTIVFLLIFIIILLSI